MNRLLPAIFAFIASLLITHELHAELPGIAELKSWKLTSDSPSRGYPLAGPMPVFPIELARAGIQGTCTVRIVVGKDGRAAQVSVLRSTLKEFVAPTIAAVNQWRFIEVVNTKKNERPVGMIIECTLAFVLDDL